MKLQRGVYEKHIRSYSPGSVIFKEADPGSEMYIIIEGKVEIRKATTATAAKTLIVLGKGDVFGEMAIIEKKRRSATALATTSSKLLVLNERLFEATLEGNSDFARKMIRVLSERLRRANTLIQSTIMTSRENQVVSGIVQYAQEYGKNTYKGYRFNLDRFIRWAASHLGISDRDIRLVISGLSKRGVLLNSALGEREVIFRKMA